MGFASYHYQFRRRTLRTKIFTLGILLCLVFLFYVLNSLVLVHNVASIVDSGDDDDGDDDYENNTDTYTDTDLVDIKMAEHPVTSSWYSNMVEESILDHRRDGGGFDEEEEEGDGGGGGGGGRRRRHKAKISKEEEEEREEEEEDEKGKENNEDQQRLERYDILYSNPEHQHRLTRAFDECFRRPKSPYVSVMVDKSKKAAMCVVPQIASTYWINIFRFISNDTGRVVYRSPTDIPRMKTHHTRRRPEYKVSRTWHDEISFLHSSFRFMFVRHPVRRLWSVWVNKFLLPPLWFSEGPDVNRVLRVDNPIDVKCPTNITFERFVRYLTSRNNMIRPALANEHWRPIRYLCDQCIFKPHFIGKLESFSEDSELALYVINKELLPVGKRSSAQKTAAGTSGRRNESGNKSSTTTKSFQADGIWLQTSYKGDRAVYEMRMQTNYVMELVNTKAFKGHMTQCGLSELFVARRLWKAFQYDGYIRSESAFPLNLARWNPDEWHVALLQAYRHWPKDHRTRKERQRAQKERMFQERYTHIPVVSRLNLRKLYWTDFVTFGYDFEP